MILVSKYLEISHYKYFMIFVSTNRRF